MHYPILVIIPREYVEGEDITEEDMLDYIRAIMAPYNENLVVPPYIEVSYAQLRQDWLNSGLTDRYPDPITYAIEDEGYDVDQDGNVISTRNPDGLYDYYAIGGGWNGFLQTGRRRGDVNQLDGNIVSVPTVITRYNQPLYPNEADVHWITFRPEVIIDTDGTVYGRQGEPIDAATFYRLMGDHPDDYVVLLDAHT